MSKINIELTSLTELFGYHKKKSETERTRLLMMDEIRSFAFSDFISEWYKNNVKTDGSAEELTIFRDDLITNLSANDFEVWKQLIQLTS